MILTMIFCVSLALNIVFLFNWGIGTWIRWQMFKEVRKQGLYVIPPAVQKGDYEMEKDEEVAFQKPGKDN